MRVAVGVLSVVAFLLVLGASFAGTVIREPLATAAYLIIVVLAAATLGMSIAARKKN
jgi:hypothetical protein